MITVGILVKLIITKAKFEKKKQKQSKKAKTQQKKTRTTTTEKRKTTKNNKKRNSYCFNVCLAKHTNYRKVFA